MLYKKYLTFYLIYITFKVKMAKDLKDKNLSLLSKKPGFSTGFVGCARKIIQYSRFASL